ncbi:hypothetical protein ACQKOF_21975 [Lysinibacillus sp. NPDC093190]
MKTKRVTFIDVGLVSLFAIFKGRELAEIIDVDGTMFWIERLK